MLLEICTQIYFVVFALSRQINKQKVCENTLSPCEGNTVFVKYQAQGGGFNPNPLAYALSLCKGVSNEMATNVSIHDAIQILPKLPVSESIAFSGVCSCW